MERSFLNKESFEKLNLANYYWYKEVFSPKEVKAINLIGSGLEKEEGTILDDEKSSNLKVRDSKVGWIDESLETKWIYDKIYNQVIEANNNCWNFNLVGFSESFQYATYTAPSSHYDYHLDIDGGANSPALERKVSVVVFLTDPKEYEGGELVIKTSPTEKVLKEKAGTSVLFPSYLLHKINPVTKGSRNSLVLWVSGPPFS